MCFIVHGFYSNSISTCHWSFLALIYVLSSELISTSFLKILQPSKDLERLLNGEGIKDSISCTTISSICKTYDLDRNVIVKYRNLR